MSQEDIERALELSRRTAEEEDQRRENERALELSRRTAEEEEQRREIERALRLSRQTAQEDLSTHVANLMQENQNLFRAVNFMHEANAALQRQINAFPPQKDAIAERERELRLRDARILYLEGERKKHREELEATKVALAKLQSVSARPLVVRNEKFFITLVFLIAVITAILTKRF